MPHLTVIDPGPRTTVEDLGRAMVGRFGVPRGGAFDPLALAIANRLVGNRTSAAGLELTLRGPELRYEGDCRLAFALTGADLAAEVAAIDGRSRPVACGATSTLEPGERLRCGEVRGGARAWLAFSGGVDVPPVLGARSTCAAASFGGFSGRALRAGDALPLGEPHVAAAPVAPPSTASRIVRAAGAVVLRLLPGPQRALFAGDPLAGLEAAPWSVAPASDRRGIRLSCDRAAVRERLAGVPGIRPEGTTLGAIQVTPDGNAIVLGPDRPVTGGYAKPACVIAADLPAIAQLRPGDAVRFYRIALDEACRMRSRALAELDWDLR